VPSLALAAVAWLVAGLRTYELAWRAVLDSSAFQAALEARLSSGQLPEAIALCRALAPAWPADYARALLEARAQGGEAEETLDELREGYEFRAQKGLSVLLSLSRMAFPLALGSAIVVLSGAFDAASIDIQQAERALRAAFECLLTGGLTVFFCRSAFALLGQKAASRVREIRALDRLLHA